MHTLVSDYSVNGRIFYTIGITTSMCKSSEESLTRVENGGTAAAG
jgi:hypothetical protein